MIALASGEASARRDQRARSTERAGRYRKAGRRARCPAGADRPELPRLAVVGSHPA